MSGPIFGTAWGSRIVVLFKWGEQFWGPKTVSILGPNLETILPFLVRLHCKIFPTMADQCLLEEHFLHHREGHWQDSLDQL
jgi:hypothetical protein